VLPPCGRTLDEHLASWTTLQTGRNATLIIHRRIIHRLFAVLRLRNTLTYLLTHIRQKIPVMYTRPKYQTLNNNNIKTKTTGSKQMHLADLTSKYVNATVDLHSSDVPSTE